MLRLRFCQHLHNYVLAVSWSVAATDVEREYRDEDEVGEVKRGDEARDACGAGRRGREKLNRAHGPDSSADWLASSSPSRAAFQSDLVLSSPACAFFDLRRAARCSGRSGACTRDAAVREERVEI